MAIILEGMDNSGKSTLAKKFGLEVVHPGPRPRTWGEEQTCMIDQQRDARLPIVMDRVTCISSQVYKKKLFDKVYMEYLDPLVYTHNCVVIYCRPPAGVILDMTRHEAKSYDTKEHLASVQKNARLYIESYDKLFKSTPHLVYNYITPNDSIIDMAMDMVFNIGAWKKWMK